MKNRFLKDKSCVYLYAINTPEAREILIERWGRMPESEKEAEDCKCPRPKLRNE